MPYLNMNPEKAMAPHSSTLAWKIPWMEEPGRLQSVGSRRVGPNWATSLSLFTFMHWRRKWQPTPVFLPGESQGREPDGLPPMGSHRVGHDWRDLAAEADLNQPWVHICPPILNPHPSLSPHHPSGLSQSTGFECPASYIKLTLVIYFTYGNMHVSMLFSPIILPFPSPM